ncbi:helix-turn-helix domain-containing protein [Embleya sp. NPDC055664]
MRRGSRIASTSHSSRSPSLPGLLGGPPAVPAGELAPDARLTGAPSTSMEPEHYTTDRERLAALLRRLRLAAGLIGAQVAADTGMSQPKISKWETGKLLPSGGRHRRRPRSVRSEPRGPGGRCRSGRSAAHACRDQPNAPASRGGAPTNTDPSHRSRGT